MRMVTDRRKTCSNEVEKETKEVRNGGKRKRENTMEALGKVFMLRYQNGQKGSTNGTSQTFSVVMTWKLHHSS